MEMETDKGIYSQEEILQLWRFHQRLIEKVEALESRIADLEDATEIIERDMLHTVREYEE